MWIVLIVAAIVLLATAVAGVLCYWLLSVPARKPLTETELILCRRIVASRRGYPFICRQAVRTGMCGCQPCSKMEKELEALEA